ncbi:MAG: Crp/Fnr family transcriptional regulator [Treponema sp.]|nr:Crp/Fnr family transcriptional regulator [Treponema sp.]
MKNYENYLDVLESTGIFKNIDNSERSILLECMNARTENIKKGQIILLAGNKLESFGIVLAGLFHIIRENYEGNRSLIAAMPPGGIFAEALCCAGVTISPVTVIAAEDSCYMKLYFPRFLKTCSSSCTFHVKLIENMTSIIAKKNLMMQNKMEILELKTIREKVMRYLESFSKINITLPFNREEMADFLCVERTALSHELIKMKKDGLIDYKKNKFVML